MKTENLNLIDAARYVLKAAGYYTEHLWHIADIHFIAEQLDMEKLTDEEVAQVFAIASEGFDGDTGISWPQLERALQQFQQRKKAVQELAEATKPRLEKLW